MVPRLYAIALAIAVVGAVAITAHGATLSSVTAGAEASRFRNGLTPAELRYWDRVARCETGGNWRAPGPTYQGGLGFYWATWDWWAGELGLGRRYPDAHLAPRLVQIAVAKYGRNVHRGYWGCA